jgi:hypothetical protein
MNKETAIEAASAYAQREGIETGNNGQVSDAENDYQLVRFDKVAFFVSPNGAVYVKE